MYDFDEVIDRRGTAAEKWDGHYPGHPDAIPLWVADMDFAAPPEVSAALMARVQHGVYGYSFPQEDDYRAAIDWRRARCAQAVKAEWITFSTGVVCSLKAAVLAFTQPGEKVVVQPPVYPPFMRLTADLGREVLENHLLQAGDGSWHLDFEGLEDCFRAGSRLMLLCSSHNPVGRVWTLAELNELAALCRRYHVLVISDEIHCDILRPGHKHIALADMPDMTEQVITLVSATKTFNLAGLQNSVAITADREQKRRLERELFRANHNTPNLFGMLAQKAAWTHGEPWLAEMNAYIAGNCDRARQILANQQRILPNDPQGTYLLWLDCRGLGMSDVELQHFFVGRCGVFPTMGKPYGAEGFVRLNLATRRALIEEAVGRVVEEVGKL